VASQECFDRVAQLLGFLNQGREAAVKRIIRLVAYAITLSTFSFAQDTYKLVYRFNSKTQGQSPTSPLTIVGSVGFGDNMAGIYKAQASGVKVGINSVHPTAGLAVDASQNVYGVDNGTSGTCLNPGRIFEIATRTKPWRETDLHDFTGPDGYVSCEQFMEAPVIIDQSGNIWGTTAWGGSNTCTEDAFGCGVIFELVNSQGTWTESVIHAFAGPPTDGSLPAAGLTFNAATGSYYGTTYAGGAYNLGTVYQLAPDGNGGWTEIVLHSFQGGVGDGIGPYAGVTVDSQGNLYGTTGDGGAGGYGMVWELTNAGQFISLHEFTDGSDGGIPVGSLTFDLQGNLWGTTFKGGNFGVLFELTPSRPVGWQFSVFHSFMGGMHDGANPSAGLTLDGSGNLYGTTEGGGFLGGTIYEVVAGKN
jgi:uncharacterized repeat protein (TIGR03803 family)